MDSTRYVQIPCRVCGGKSLAVGGQPRPAECIHCKSPLDGRPPERAQASRARLSDPAMRAPATFERGTFTHTPAPGQNPRPTTATPSPSNASKTAHGAAPAPGSLKDRLRRLLAHR